MKSFIIGSVLILICAGHCPAQSLYNDTYLMDVTTDSFKIFDQFWYKPKMLKLSTGDSIFKKLNISGAIAMTYLSDKTGNLQFASNGCFIVDSNGKEVNNPYNYIKDGPQYNFACGKLNGTFSSGFSIRFITSIPNDHKEHDFTIFQLAFSKYPIARITSDDNKLIFTQLHESQGEYQIYNSGIINLPDHHTEVGLTMVRHADGKSWWLIVPLFQAGTFVSIHVNESGLPNEQVVSELNYPLATPLLGIYGSPKENYVATVPVVSPDGSKLAVFDYYRSDIVMYSIDRCTGSIFNPRVVFKSNLDENGVYFEKGIGLAFSPNSRYLYAGTYKRELQFDTDVSDIPATIYALADSIYRYKLDLDTSKIKIDPVFYTAKINYSEQFLGIDNKIHIQSRPQESSLRIYDPVIEHPDLPGEKCGFKLFGDFKQYGQESTHPNTPNFDLGPLPPGSCETSKINTDVLIKSTGENTEVEIINIPLGVHQICVKIYDVLGQELMRKCESIIPFQDYSKIVYFETAILPPACYFATVYFDNGDLITKKFLVLK